MTPERRSLALAMALVFMIAAAAAALGIGVRSTYGGHAAVDEPQYLLSALSLWEDHDLDISDELAQQRWKDFYEAQLPVQTAVRSGGSQVSPHDPLLPVLLAVPMGLGGWVAAKAAMALIAGAAAALTVWVAVRRFSVPPGLAVTGVAIAFASPPLVVYGQQIYPELPAAAVVLVGVAALTGSMRRAGWTAWVLAAVALPWLSVKYTPVAAALALVGLVRLLRTRPGSAVGAAVASLAAFAAAGLVYAVAHRLIWGGWTVYASGDHFQGSGEFGAVGFSPDYFGRSLRLIGLFADRGFGLVAWQPAWILGVVALGALARRRPPGWLALVLPLAAGYATATWVALTMHGFWWPGRQLVVVLPVLLVAVLWWLGAVAPGWVRIVAGVLGAVGVLSYAALLRDGYGRLITWVVDFEKVRDPVYSALRPIFPDYRGANFVGPHLGWTLVIVLLASAGWHFAGPERPVPDGTRTLPVRPKEGALS